MNGMLQVPLKALDRKGVFVNIVVGDVSFVLLLISARCDNELNFLMDI